MVFLSRCSIIFSCKPESADLCLNELHRRGLDLRFMHWLAPGLGVLSSKDSFSEIAAVLATRPLIFLLHLFPWEYTVPWGGQRRASSAEGPGCEMLSLTEALSTISLRLERDSSFSVQFGRAQGQGLDEDPRKEVREYLLAQGFVQNMRHPEQIITIYHSEGQLYIGLSLAWQNISSWFAGRVTYAVREDTVSRAEFKLLEALDHFGLQLPAGGLALDLGAAPGGWSKVCLDRGLRVIAIDPGEMAASLRQHVGLQHFRGTAQQFLQDYQGGADLLLNDMRLEVGESVEICLQAAQHLQPGALLFMTFKLPKNQKMTPITSGQKALATAFDVLHLKQLYHNRSEITVIARKNRNGQSECKWR